MRYIKVLFLACLIFLALVFFFQNQTILSTKMELKLDLFFIPPMTSISLPFYFLVICAFFVGVVLALTFLVWDRLNLSARIMKDKWQIQNLSSKLAQAEKLVKAQGYRTWCERLRDFFSLEQAAPVAQTKNTVATKPVNAAATPAAPQAKPNAAAAQAPVVSDGTKQPA